MTPRIYEEVVELIVSEPTAAQVIAFKPSEAAQTRFWDLIYREKSGEITGDEKSELDHFMQAEHIMRLAKARARLRLLAKP
jgi:hypothetical protein